MRGDVPAALDRLAEDVQWEARADNHAQRAGVPWMTPRTGRDGVAEFFSVVRAREIREFSVLGMMAAGTDTTAG